MYPEKHDDSSTVSSFTNMPEDSLLHLLKRLNASSGDVVMFYYIYSALNTIEDIIGIAKLWGCNLDWEKFRELHAATN